MVTDQGGLLWSQTTMLSVYTAQVKLNCYSIKLTSIHCGCAVTGSLWKIAGNEFTSRTYNLYQLHVIFTDAVHSVHVQIYRRFNSLQNL